MYHPAHLHVSNTTNVKLVFLPPNTTSMLQLMDQEVIGSLTAQNRRQIVQMYINERVLKP